jgi:hypothetical protein
MTKPRTRIPDSVAAQVLFTADRTCCVCRQPDKPLQIHHIDDNPINHKSDNLAVLCLECHEKTQISGGFSRKLDLHQIRLYRDSWNETVAAKRSIAAESEAEGGTAVSAGPIDAALATSIVEINREAKNWANLALFYDSIGNEELRDRAIDEAIAGGLRDWNVIRLRRLQGRLSLVPPAILQSELDGGSGKSAFAVGGIYEDLSEHRKAAEMYLGSLAATSDEISDFTLAFELKQMLEGTVIPGLFLNALQRAADKKDLWWQVRALEELGWTAQLHELVQRNRDVIDSSKMSDECKWRVRIILAEADESPVNLQEARLEYEKIRASCNY